MHFLVGIIIPKNEQNKHDYIEETMDEFSSESETHREFDIEIAQEDFKQYATKLLDKLIKDENTSVDTLFTTIKTYREWITIKKYKEIILDHESYQENNGNLGYFYNPSSFYDWYTTDGRWNGFFNGKNMITLGTYKQLLKNTPDDKLLYGIVTKDLEYISQDFQDKEELTRLIFDQNDNDFIQILDCHM